MSSLILFFSVVIGYLAYTIIDEKRIRHARILAQSILQTAQVQSQHRQREILGAIQQEQELQQSYEQSIAELTNSNQALAEKLEFQEIDLAYFTTKVDRLEEKLKIFQKELEESTKKNQIQQTQIDTLRQNIQQTLLERSGFQNNEIYIKFFSDFEEELTQEYLKIQENRREYLHANIERIASRILSSAIHRCQFGHWAENYPSSISVENLLLQEQILHSSVRNLLKKELDVNLEIEQNLILIVTPDGCKREIVRQVLHQIITTGQINIEQIKRWITLAQDRIETDLLQTGQQACQSLGIVASSEIYRLLGRLKYRTSFGQNVLWHSLEVANLAKLIAYEIGLDPQKACRAGLLHDIGKAIDHEHEGGHPEIGGEILQKFAESPEIIQGVTGHHEDATSDTPYATLISAADAISASRPGARRETFEKYIHRLEKLEAIAYNFQGVENAYAISAGREIRLIVAPDKISDQSATIVAKNIAQAIEQELHYPGKIKITVIREMKVVEYAR